MHPKFFCTVCSIQLNSENQFVNHENGQRHLRRAALALKPTPSSPVKEYPKQVPVQSFAEDVNIECEASFAIISSSAAANETLPVPFKCPVCTDFITSDALLSQQHAESREHHDNLKRETDIFLQNTMPIKSCFETLASADSAEEAIDVSTEQELNELDHQSTLFRCRNCDVVRRGRAQMSTHLNSKKHRKIVDPGSQPAESSVSRFDLNEAANRCEAFLVPANAGSEGKKTQYKCPDCCNFKCSSALKLLAHFESENHLKSVCSGDNSNAVTSVEERLQAARNHSFTCGFQYHESFPKFPLNMKVSVLGPHLAFIGKDEPVPDFDIVRFKRRRLEDA